MKRTHAKLGVLATTLVSALFMLAVQGRVTNSAASAQTAEPEKTVEQVRKNIQVMKGVPNSQLLTVMHLMRSSLGVRCDYCHVAENNKYWMDDKPAKQIARQHMLMTQELNKSNFGGRPVITCNTCHQGRPKPASVPVIGQGAFANTTNADPLAKPETMPTVEQVFSSYIKAMGGAQALGKVRTFVAKGSLLKSKLVNGGTPRAAVINRGETLPLEVFQKEPDKLAVVTQTANGPVAEIYNGGKGWVVTSGGTRPMNAAELEQAAVQADLQGALRLQARYTDLSVRGKDKIGEREVYVVEGLSHDRRSVTLYFDAVTGLLLRRITLRDVYLGANPVQEDFEDYRAVDGVQVPFTVKTSYLDDNHLGTTRVYQEVKQNEVLEDKRFEQPVSRQ
jgi:hypothetical protein